MPLEIHINSVLAVDTFIREADLTARIYQTATITLIRASITASPTLRANIRHDAAAGGAVKVLIAHSDIGRARRIVEDFVKTHHG